MGPLSFFDLGDGNSHYSRAAADQELQSLESQAVDSHTRHRALQFRLVDSCPVPVQGPNLQHNSLAYASQLREVANNSYTDFHFLLHGNTQRSVNGSDNGSVSQAV